MNNMNNIRRHVLMFGDITGLTGFQLFLDQWMAWFFIGSLNIRKFSLFIHFNQGISTNSRVN